ncbi:MAG: TetR/AcrR family transcriptional regulator, partial [Acidobacteria bacterium]|nr:TetR/AcrR family transcriptional regulator [Acidobacteriota bacterium]
MAPRKTTTRERLISAAAELFRRQGYAQTGVNQIIQGANATSGSFYH